MMEDIAPYIAGFGIIVFLAHLFTGIFNRIRIPDVLFLIVIGIVIGPVFKIISVSALGQIGPVFATITLIIILFEYGITLEMESLKHAVSGAFRLALSTFAISVAVVTGVVWWLTDLALLPSLVLGSILGSTSEAIVIPLVRQLGIKDSSRALLSVESTVTAVLSIIFALAFIETYQYGEFHIFELIGNLLSSFFVAICLGFGGAILWSLFLDKLRGFKNTMFTSAAFVFVIFGITEMLGFNGPIGVLVFGITLSNLKSLHLPFIKHLPFSETSGLTEIEKNFFSEIAFLLKAFFFVYLGLSLEMISSQMIIFALALVGALVIIRLLTTKFSLGKALPPRDTSMISVMIPRGLTAIILAAIPLQQGMAGGDTIKKITYGVVLFSIALTSILVILVEKTAFSNILGKFFQWRLFKSKNGAGGSV